MSRPAGNFWPQRRWWVTSGLIHTIAIVTAIVWVGWQSIPSTPLTRVTLALETTPPTPPPVEPVVVVPVTAELAADAPLEEPPPIERAEHDDAPPIESCIEPEAEERPEPVDWLLRIQRPRVRVTPTPTPVPTETRSTTLPTPQPGHNPPPRYPARALRLGIAGTVELRVRVAADGTVLDCVIATSSGSDLLDRAARRAVADWRFANGPGTTLVPVVFTIRRSVP